MCVSSPSLKPLHSSPAPSYAPRTYWDVIGCVVVSTITPFVSHRHRHSPRRCPRLRTSNPTHFLTHLPIHCTSMCMGADKAWSNNTIPPRHPPFAETHTNNPIALCGSVSNDLSDNDFDSQESVHEWNELDQSVTMHACAQ